MQFALVGNETKEAFPKGRGKCLVCDSPMIAKCGERNINHWAHDRNYNCDPWWEPETDWHRKWKNLFPSDCLEVIHIADNGEVHRADIKTKSNIIIEIQHSSISDKERISRELFYKNMVWVIDGNSFIDRFFIYHMLPNPKSDIAEKIVWFKAKKNYNGANKGLFYWKDETQSNAFTNFNLSTMRTIESLDSIEDDIIKTYNGYHQYDWVKPKKTWLDANCPVYIDFGNEYLCQLRKYGTSNLNCIKLVSKIKFIHDVMIESDVNLIAEYFYPIT